MAKTLTKLQAEGLQRMLTDAAEMAVMQSRAHGCAWFYQGKAKALFNAAEHVRVMHACGRGTEHFIAGIVERSGAQVIPCDEFNDGRAEGYAVALETVRRYFAMLANS